MLHSKYQNFCFHLLEKHFLSALATSNTHNSSSAVFDHHHSAPNIHENVAPSPHPPHPPPQLNKCPRHHTTTDHDKKIMETSLSAFTKTSSSKPKIKDTKEIMKKRRERAICVVSDENCFSNMFNMFYVQDRISRIVFPSTFVLLNIAYWLAFSDIFISIRNVAI